MSRTTQALTEICEKHRFREKLLFVPSYSIGHQLGECLAKTGTSWINLRVTTTVGYAEQLVALDLNSAGIRLIDFSERFLIVEKLYRNDGFMVGKGSYFEGAAVIPGILRCLGNAVHEMRMAGLDSKSIDRNAFITSEKGDELIRLLDCYDGFVKDNRVIDNAGLLSMAIDKVPREVNPNENTLVMVLSEFPFTPLEKELIRLVGGEDLITIAHTTPADLALPKRFFMPTHCPEEKAPEPEANIELLPWLFCPKKAPDPIGDDSVSIFHALGESNEVREVFRRVLNEETSLDEVEIIVANTEPYISMIFEMGAFLGVPVTFAGGIPITYTRPGRALILYLNWLAEDFKASYLRRLLSGSCFDLASPDLEGERPSANRAGAIIRNAAIGWGRDRYSSRLKALEESYLCRAGEKRDEGEEEKALWSERAAAQVAWVARLVEEIIATVPVADPDGAVTTSELFEGALNFLQRFCRTAGELDVAAKFRLKDVLETLLRAPSFSELPKEAAERLEAVIMEVSVGSSLPKPGRIHVAHYRSGGYSGRSHTFVLGLDQRRFPEVLIQNPVILDTEREQLGSELVLASELLQENIYVMAKVLGSLRGKVTLSYPCRDLREDREIFPSSVLLGVHRLIATDRSGDYRALTHFLGEPTGFVPAAETAALNGWEWWFSQKAVQFGTDAVHGSYPGLAEGDRAEEERDLEELSKYDGWVPSSVGALDPVDKELVLSCSRLEDLARCPYAFFIRHVLGIEPLEEVEMDLGRWLRSVVGPR